MNFNGIEVDIEQCEEAEKEALRLADEYEVIAKHLREQALISYKNRIRLTATIN
jgi:hypothetical protein